MAVKTIQTDGTRSPYAQMQPGDVFVREIQGAPGVYRAFELKRDVPDLDVDALPQENGSAIQLVDEYNTAEPGSYLAGYGTRSGGVLLRTGQNGWVRTGAGDYGANGAKYYSNGEVIKLANEAGGFFPLIRGEKVEA